MTKAKRVQGFNDYFETAAAIVAYVRDNGGEVSFKTINGVVIDVHITEPVKASSLPCSGLSQGKRYK